MLNQGIKALVDLLKSPNEKRVGLTTLEDASYATASNSTVSIATALSNVSGVVIRLASLVTTTGGECRIEVAGNVLVRVKGVTGAVGSAVVSDVFVPAGLAVDLISTAAGEAVYCQYEVL